LAEITADPVVSEFFPSALSRQESDAFAARARDHITQNGFGLWAVEISGQASFVGAVGITRVLFEVPFVPAVEIGWRLAPPHWGKGYATEAARAALQDGFERFDFAEVVSFTSALNKRSQRVMQRLGMTHTPADDFDHPRLPGHRLERHFLYRIGREAFPSQP
jgi:RimJ/RimL family protein N-acetyltransferase